MSSRFGDLRSAIARRSFSDTCAAIERWPEDDPELHELALPYAHEHLATWPGPRRAPARWADAIYAGERPPWASLADTYSYASRSFFDDGHHGSLEEPAPRLSGVLRAHDETLRALELRSCEVPPSSWRAFAHALHLHGLRELALREVSMDVEGARALTRAPFLPSLTSLSFRPQADAPSSGAPGVLLCSEYLSGLEVLEIHSLGYTVYAPIRASSLRVLRIENSQVGDPFIASACGPSLETFALSVPSPSAFGRRLAEQLVHADTPSLRSVTIDQGTLDRAASVDVLLSGRHVRQVTSLDLGGAAYVMRGGSSALAAAVARACARLERLALRRCQLGDDALDALADSPSAATLTHLDLSNNPLGPRVARALASGAFPALASLDLSGARVHPLSTLHTARARAALPALERITLSADQIDPGCSASKAVAVMREVGVQLDLGVGFVRPRRSTS